MNPTPTRRLAAPTAAVVGGSLLLAMSWPEGGVGPDAAAYLRMASWFADGGGLTHIAATPTGTARFATWPPGYPALVALGVKTGLDPWWAARSVAALAAVVCAILLRQLAPREGSLLMWWLATATPLAVFASATSEAGFLAALLALTLAATRVDEGGSTRWSLLLGASALSSFLLRYLGAYSLAVCAMVVARRARTDGVRSATPSALATLAAGAVMVAMLASNRSATGHPTGIARTPAPESWAFLGVDLLRAGFTELLPTVRLLSADPRYLGCAGVGGLALAVAVAWCVRAPPETPRQRHLAAPWLAITGALYLATLVVSRFSVHFDRFGWRLLAPGSVLLALAALLTLASRGEAVRRRMGRALPALAGLSVLCSLALAGGPPGAARRTQLSILERYADVPEGCVVGPHATQLPWLRTDLVTLMPLQLPHDGRTESVEEFTHRLEALPFACLRLEVRADLDPKRVHPTWLDLAARHADGTFLTLR